MGQGQSSEVRARCTPLECILANWKVFGADPMTKSQLKRFCTVDWPQYPLEDQEWWPPGGSINYNTILQLLPFCQRTRKWNEHMYAHLFLTLCTRPDILQRCNLTPTGSVAANVSTQTPTPTVMAEPVSPSAPTPTPCKSPMVGLYPLITETKVARSGSDRRPATTMQVYTHVPFNPVDLAAFKAQAGEFSTNPIRFISVFEGCLSSHKPNWDDCNVLLRTLLSEVERQQVVSKAREEAQRRYDRGRINVPDLDAQVPRADPRWDPNDPGAMTRLTSYKELLLHGLRHSAVRHNNWAKPYEVMQDLKESPGAFLQRIRDTIRQNTNADPDDQATESIIKGIFTSRAAPDIKRKLQKKEDLMGMTMAQILETANRAYSLRETEKERKQVRLMVTAVQAGTRRSGRGGRGRGRDRPGLQERRLGRNQCALCRQEGHWKNECPKRKEQGGAPMMAMVEQE
ncbi:unnamed protein product [Caretta caretta]